MTHEIKWATATTTVLFIGGLSAKFNFGVSDSMPFGLCELPFAELPLTVRHFFVPLHKY